MDASTGQLFMGAFAVLYLIYRYFTRNFDYWMKRRIAGPKPIAFFGNVKDVVLYKVHEADYTKLIYDTYSEEPVIGLFALNKPFLLVRDPEIIKDVLIKSFSTFPDRGFTIHEDIDPISQHLLFLGVERWKPLRRKLTPVFSSGKLKEMFYLVNECADQFVQYIGELAGTNKPIDVRELAAQFTIDVIGVCVFGLKMNAMSDESCTFRKIGHDMFADSWRTRARQTVRTLPYWAAVLLKPIVWNGKDTEFFVKTLMSTMEYRKKNNVRRNDFVDRLMDIRDQPKSEGEEELTDILLTAQAFIFFLAGYETSATAMSNAMYELALNPHVQDKLRDEVVTTFDKYDGKLDYDNVKDMKYLDKVCKETLRKYPPAYATKRVARADHTFSGTKISISEGTGIIIPIYAIHHDANIYPDPEKFDPDRFNEEVAALRPPMSYLPFSEGPRNCIGERFAHIQTKLGLASAIKNFKFEVCEETCKVYKKRFNNLVLMPDHGLYLKITKL